MSYLEMKHISKRFPGVRALDDVNFAMERGTVHALLGENGAGKSTLMNILCGLYSATEGEIYLSGSKLTIKAPKDSIKAGIGMVHQHFMLIPNLTVVENLALGMQKSYEFLDLNHVEERLVALCNKYKMDIPPRKLVSELTVGQCQRLEILKALYRGAELLILDEPTAVLTPQEVGELYEIIRTLIAEGNSIIFITHKLKEVMDVCNYVTVLRRGKHIETLSIDQITSYQMLAKLMIGQDLNLELHKSIANPGRTILHIDTLSFKGKLKDFSLDVHAGEIVGIAGVDGNGQKELIECITGLDHATAGRVEISGKDVTKASVKEILNQQVGHIPEDRQKYGIVADMSIKENLIMMAYNTRPLCGKFFINWNMVRQYASRIIEEFHIKTPSIEELSQKLSGGNQQRLVLGRELQRKPDLLIAVHPVRGLDIGATQYIFERIISERDRGAAVLLVSTELDDIIALSDTVAVMCGGELMGTVTGDEIHNRPLIGLMMAGVHYKDAKTELISNDSSGFV